jgi:hypothetical protein
MYVFFQTWYSNLTYNKIGEVSKYLVNMLGYMELMPSRILIYSMPENNSLLSQELAAD